ncbi:MAG: hypothetical protein IKK13_02645 [Clostridia bacterium]|nr:hypothetical protein [Clostridia bacterium]
MSWTSKDVDIKDTSAASFYRVRNIIVLFILDAISIAGSFFAALWLRFEFSFDEITPIFFQNYFKTIGI